MKIMIPLKPREVVVAGKTGTVRAEKDREGDPAGAVRSGCSFHFSCAVLRSPLLQRALSYQPKVHRGNSKPGSNRDNAVYKWID